MKKLLIPIALSSILFTSFASQASFKDAVANYESGKYQEALTEFQSLAEIGNTGAQYNLGFMYLDGLGTKQDLVKAYAWIKLSDEEAKSTETQDVLKQIEKHFSDEDLNLADKTFSRLQANFSHEVMVSELKPVFDITKNGEAKFKAIPIKTTAPEFPHIAKRKGIEGFIKVTFSLASDGSPKDIRIAKSYPEGVFDKSALRAIKRWKFKSNADSAQLAPMNYTIKYEFGAGYSSKAKSLINDIKSKAEAGDALSQFYYAKYGPEVLSKERINATEWYYKSALQGVADSMHEVGMSLMYGQGCIADKEKGLKWLTRAASGNLGRSQLKLSKLYAEIDSEESRSKSQFWLEKARMAKDKDIAFDVARILAKRKDYSPQQIIEQLEIVNDKQINSPGDFYELYASSYAKLNDFDKAAEYQNKANKIYRRYGKVPQDMREKLKEYKAKRDA